MVATKQSVCYVWIQDPSPRLAKAQEELEKSILSFGLHPLRFPGGRSLTMFGEVLLHARKNANSHAMVWCNSDVVLTKNPFDVPDPECTYGFHRIEIPSGEICSGVDMYYIPLSVWDSILSRDIPSLYIGASFVDWWISRKLAARKEYSNLTGYITHVSHEKSGAAADSFSGYYRKNLRGFNSYAKRHGLEPIKVPPLFLPKIGYFWGIRDAIKKISSLYRKK